MSENNTGFTIRPEDVIPRPKNLPAVQAGTPNLGGSGNMITQVKTFMKDAQEIMKMAQDSGIIDMLKQARRAPVQDQGEAPPDQRGTAGVNGLTQALMLFRASYGDITVNELIANFRRDYGDLKLSEILQLFGSK